MTRRTSHLIHSHRAAGPSFGAMMLICLLAVVPRPAAAALKNGDLDDDGSRNIVDAVYLVQYLFLDGAPPVPVVVKRGVPTTGQRDCYDSEAIIPCPVPGEPYYGQDGNHPGIPHDYQVVKPDPGDSATWTTIDYSTALMWQYQPPAGLMTWPHAIDYCAGLVLGGYDDWRLPNITELSSILDLDRESPYIDTDAFAITFNEPWYHTYFASTTPAANRSEKFVISFKYGSYHFTPRDGGYDSDFVRAVRSIARGPANGDINGDGEIDINDPIRLLFFIFVDGQEPAPLKQVIGLPVPVHCDGPSLPEEMECLIQPGSDEVGVPRDFTVVKPDPASPATWSTIDHATGLMWQYAEDLTLRDWRDALSYCEGLELGGFDDWRLPSAKELQTLINYGKSHPAIDLAYFGAESYPLEGRDNWTFWSATPHYGVYMDIGLIATDQPGSRSWVRAVRTLRSGDPE
jgi:uncharacterized protein DUF1566